ncbi:UDP-3-O-(3-hydroxymyristoyl)glucosamine N-acyltransferase [Deltaproteobacteria bacterium TL4]
MQCSLRELCEKFGVSFSGNGDLIISHACGLDDLQPGGIAYITSPKGLTSVPLPVGVTSSATVSLKGASDQVAIIAPVDVQSSGHNLVFTEDPLWLHVRVTEYFNPHQIPSEGIHPSVVMGENVHLGENVFLGANVVLYDGVQIGNGSVLHAGVVVMNQSVIGEECLLYPGVVIREGCAIGNRVAIHANAVIGSDGHGYFQRKGINIKIPQVGSVLIEDDVEIGACTTIDRARFTQTVIRKGSKLDNQVQIAHNVEIGEQALISAQTAIGGSTKTGHHLIMGGQSGIRDHVEVGNHVTAAARAVITSKAKDNEILGGMPSRPLNQWRTMQAQLNRLDELFDRVRYLEEQTGVNLWQNNKNDSKKD